MYKINKTIIYNYTTFLLTCTTVRVMVCCSLKVVENVSRSANEYWDETISLK